MSKRKLITSGSPFEKTIGYSRAVVQGDWCFIAGVTGYDYTTMQIPADPAAQTENCFKTIMDVLKQADFSLSDTVRVQYTIIKRDLIAQITPVLGRYFGEIRPAATMIIADLVKPEMLLEVEITALRG